MREEQEKIETQIFQLHTEKIDMDDMMEQVKEKSKEFRFLLAKGKQHLIEVCFIDSSLFFFGCVC